MCSYGVSGPTSIPQSFLRTFLKLCSNSVHFKKRRSFEQAFSKCQEHNAGHAVGALKSTLPFLHKFQPFLLDDTIFVEKMKRYARCLKIINFVQLVFSPIPAMKTFHKHGFFLAVSHFAYHSRIATQLLMSQGPVTRCFDREQHSPLRGGKCNILKHKKHNKKFFWPKSFFQWCFIRSEQ